ncbi:beta-N-acetylhexosaminidase [Actinoplanes sp. RD1]|uniref:beta-N-acetylhexosaminidase n=1 Tax=Actinoplanes sp. RD1 TaxID=3064538 RepID=UPI002741B74A|nr:beta-N-acetylhexosaminidase [Actinoplanes sp. RD1]
MATHVISRALAAAALALPLVASPATAAPPQAPALSRVIPAPAEVTPAPGATFRLTALTAVTAPPAARKIADQLARELRPATGYALPVLPATLPGLPSISLQLGGTGAREGYTLTVTPKHVTIRAAALAGLFNGTRTLLQLLPAEIDSRTVVRTAWTINGGTIKDFPRYAYRGAMLDLARHFHTPAEVKAYIDEISRFKVNHLHLHLTDDQGWRIQIKSWPRLTQDNGGPGVDGEGPGFLTQAEYADIVRYAAARYVTIIPEVDMPGHVNAAQVAYPELTCDGVAPPPRTDTEVGYSSLCIGSETTYRFVDDVLRELAALTPGPYLHIGGDEAHATTEADYVTFQNRVLPLVAKYGKTAYGWNEIAKSPAAATAVAQYWGTTTTNPTLAAAVTKGTKVVMSPANKAYIDQKYDPSTPIGLSWAGYIEVRDAYGWDPATHLAGVTDPAVIGVEAPLWSETLRDLDDIEFLAFPRLPAIAELGWSPAATHDWTSFSARLGAYGPRWTLRGVDFYRSPQITWE